MELEEGLTAIAFAMAYPMAYVWKLHEIGMI